VAIIGARTIGTTIFNVLDLVCGIYLCWLGYHAMMSRRLDDGSTTFVSRDPFRRGLAFGLSNPKAYPVAVAMFTALLADHAARWLAGVAAPACHCLLRLHRRRLHPDRHHWRRSGAPVVPPARAVGHPSVRVIFLGFGLQAIVSARG